MHFDQRKKAQQISPDRFVLDEAPTWRERYQEYLEKLLHEPQVLLIRYEDLIAHFPHHLSRILKHFGVTPNPDRIEEVFKEQELNVSREDPSRHRRQIAWGDFRRKLSPRTVDHLNQTFEDVLSRLDYPVDGEQLTPKR